MDTSGAENQTQMPETPVSVPETATTGSEWDDVMTVDNNDDDKASISETYALIDLQDVNMEEPGDITAIKTETPDVNPDVTKISESDAVVSETKPTKVHPYQHLIDNFTISPLYLTKIKKIKTRSIEKVPCTFVATRAMLTEIVEQLALEKEIGVVMKDNTLGYKPRLCLLLISTRRANYLIDTIKLQNSLHMLGDIFASEKILKIMHGAVRILKSLQLNCNLFFVNIFDTKAAMKKLKWTNLSLKDYVAKYNVNLGKEVLFTKWHLRPLPEKYKIHALTYMHYLIPTYLFLKNKLLSAGVMEEFLRDCNKRCGIVYEPMDPIESFFHDVAFMHPSKVYAITKLAEWRDNLARKKKKNPNLILYRAQFHKLVDKMPTKRVQILEVASSEHVAQHIVEVQKILIDAKKAIGPLNSRFAANVNVAGKQDAEKKPAIKTEHGKKPVVKKEAGKKPLNQKKDVRFRRVFGNKQKGRVIPGGVNKRNTFGGANNSYRPGLSFRKPTIPKREIFVKRTSRINNNDSRPAPNFARTQSARIPSLMSQVRDMFSQRIDPWSDSERSVNFNGNNNRRWQDRSPDRSRNFNSRPPIWEQPLRNERNVWDDAPSRKPFETWNNPSSILSLNLGSLPLGFGNRSNANNSINLNQNMFERNDFGNSSRFSNSFGDSGNSLFQRRENFGSNSSFRNFDKPYRNSDFVSYPKYNPSNYSKQGYY